LSIKAGALLFGDILSELYMYPKAIL